MSDVLNAAPAASESSVSASEAPSQASSMTPAQAALLPSEHQGGAVEALKDQAANGSPKEQVQAKKMLKQLKIKFNGKESVEDLPFEIPDDAKSIDYMTRQLQMSKLSQSKAQEYSDLEKEVKSFVEALKKDPRKVLSDPTIGIDIKQLAAQVIEEAQAKLRARPARLRAVAASRRADVYMRFG